MKVVVCIGSGCHIKGSRIVVDKLRELISEYELNENVSLSGTFCMGNCQHGVSVTVDDELFSVNEGNVNDFFKKEILAKL